MAFSDLSLLRQWWSSPKRWLSSYAFDNATEADGNETKRYSSCLVATMLQVTALTFSLTFAFIFSMTGWFITSLVIAITDTSDCDNRLIYLISMISGEL